MNFKCYLSPLFSNSDFWVQNRTIFGPFCPKKFDFRPKSEKIKPFRCTASIWFLTSALMVPQARLWCLQLFSCLHLTIWNLPDSQLCLESKTEPSLAKGGDIAQKTDIVEGGTPHIPYWGGDTAHALLWWGHRK